MTSLDQPPQSHLPRHQDSMTGRLHSAYLPHQGLSRSVHILLGRFFGRSRDPPPPWSTGSLWTQPSFSLGTRVNPLRNMLDSQAALAQAYNAHSPAVSQLLTRHHLNPGTTRRPPPVRGTRPRLGQRGLYCPKNCPDCDSIVFPICVFGQF